MAAHPSPAEQLRLAEPLVALSFITDLTLGYPEATALRACLVALRLAEEAGSRDSVPAYWVTLLRYVGCTATAHEAAVLLGGDDIAANRRLSLVDQARPLEAAAALLPMAGRGKPPLGRARDAARIAVAGKRIGADVERAHCEVARRLAERFGLAREVADALFQVGERWDGKGHPAGLRGDEIAPATRLAVLAHVIADAHAAGGVSFAAETVRRLAGRLVDPALAAIFLRSPSGFAELLAVEDPWELALAAEPGEPFVVPAAHLDDVARGFADVVDLKTPFLHGHSTGVAELARAAADALALPADTSAAVYRAGLLHDLGRVGVPTGIWEKPGPLSASEWERVRLHPYVTERILARSGALAPLAQLAAMHHERLDGSGYHRGARAPALDLPARILGAADVFQALVEPRPHRSAFAPEAAADELGRMARDGLLDGQAVTAVRDAAGHSGGGRRGDWPAGLTNREVEVLRLLAQGRSKREIARELVLSPSTVHTHVVHVYEKAAVSSRAGVALFAMEHGLVAR